MSIKDNIRALDQEWEIEYKKYEDDFNVIKPEMYGSHEALAQAVSTTNSVRVGLSDQIKDLHDFLSKWKVKENITPFDYVDELPVILDPVEKIQNKHTKKYSYKSEMSFLEKVNEYANWPADNLNPYNRIKYKKEYKLILDEFEKERNSWLNCIEMCKDRKTYYDMALKITKLYREVLMTIQNAVQHTIIPELNGIKSFLYAEAVKDSVMCDGSLDGIHPVDINEYEGSTAYGKHYTFVKNAHDFYTMIVSYFTTQHLTNLLRQATVNEQDKNAFNDKFLELKNQTKLLEKNMIFTEGKDE